MISPPEPNQTLDLRTTKCPLNFVKTKLALEKMAPGQVLEIWILTESQSALNIPNSIRQEGHEILAIQDAPAQSDGEPEAGLQKIWILKSEGRP